MLRILLLVPLVAACSSSTTPPAAGGQAAPEFLLLDVNDTSPTSGQLVSPRQVTGNVSAWYFGSAT